MQVIEYPNPGQWPELIKRPELNDADLERQVAKILEDVRLHGDAAVRKYTMEFDGQQLQDLAVSPLEMASAVEKISGTLQRAIGVAAENIRTFHAVGLETGPRLDTMPGISCWYRYAAIEKVGIYIPGGTAPLFSTVLMLGIPAKLAGCREIVLCTPPGTNGTVNPAILYTAGLLGIQKVFRIGGIQAIAAMAFGTDTVPEVQKIFGPGNQYVACAKKLVNISGTAIDMQAGPSEMAILADETAVASFVAADLLAQAEHGPDSQVLLVTWVKELLDSVQKAIMEQLRDLPRGEIVRKALEHSRLILVENVDQGIALVNAYAPEHLIVNCAEDEQVAGRINHAGSVFLGNYSPESVGDYASGTNHTLPTNGQARIYSGVSVASFVKRITLQKLSREGLQHIGGTVLAMAAAEGLEAHGRSVSIRLSSIEQERIGK
jgi:histidinol dehydrogenase